MFYLIFIISMFFSSECLAKSFPYEFSKKVDVSILATSGVFALYSHVVLENNSSPSEQEIDSLNREDVNPLDRPYAGEYDSHMQEVSNVYLYTAIPAFTLGSSLLIDYHSSLKLMALATESLVVAGALTQLAKASVRRFRPRAYPESDLGLQSKLRKDQTNSFFSGHGSAISASCGFTAKVFSDYFPGSNYRYLVWASMLSIGAAGSWLRVEAGAHFPSDAITGFVVGFASSWGVLELHKRDSVSIIADPSQDKITLEYRLKF